MVSPESFVPLHLEGGRFDVAVHGDDVGFPLEALDELKRYEEAIVAVAAALWRAENPGRKNLPPNFADSVRLRLTGLEKGSVRTRIATMKSSGKIAAADLSWGPAARSLFVAALAAVVAGQPVPIEFPDSALPALAKVAKGLQASETAVFQGGGGAGVRYGVADQQRLAERVRTTRSRNGQLMGRFTAFNADAQSFSFRQRFGTLIPGRFLNVGHLEQIRDLTEKRADAPYVLIDCAYALDVKDQVTAVEDLSIITVVSRPSDPHGDEVRRLVEFAPGWMEGGGAAPAAKALVWLRAFTNACADGEVELPVIFPTEEGGLMVEAQDGAVRWSLEVEPDGSPLIVVAGGGRPATVDEPDTAAAAVRSLKEFRA